MNSRTFSKWTIAWIFSLIGWILALVANGQTWRVSTTINASVAFNGVHFTSDQTGYVVGTGGAIYKTSDGGLNWTTQTSNTTENLNDIFFINSTTGFAVGDNGTIRKTTDAGTTWTTLSATGTSTTTFNEVLFTNASNGYIAGSGGKLIKTTNGGTNWTTLTTGTSSDIQGIHFNVVSTGYFVAGAGLIRKTTDGGTNWTTLTISTTEDLYDIYFLDTSTGYACGSNGQVWKTVDAGTNWTLKNTGMGSLTNFSIHFADALNANASSAGGWHYVTVDGAENWISYNLSGVGTLQDTYYSSAYTGYMVGTAGILVKYQSELEPEIQASDLVFTEVYATSMKVSYSASPDIPSGYIAIRKTGSAPTTDPVDGITYTLGGTLGDGTVAFIGNATSFNETLLTSDTEYFYKIYAYNGAGAAINYKPTTPLSGSRRTYASGNPWSSAFSSSFTFPEDVHFYDANTGAVAGTFNLLTTSDGGQNWTNGFPSNGDSYGGVFFVNATTAYAVGTNSSIRVIRRTVSAGATWVDQVRVTSTYGFNDVWFTNTITGFAVGGEGQIHRTTNGISWSSVSSGTTTDLHGVHFPTSTTGYAVGNSGVIVKTINSGASWIPVPGSGIVTTNNLKAVFFSDSQTGYIVGAAGTLLKTIDGGTSWTVQTTGTTEDLYSIHFVDASTGYLVGDNGTILKTTDAGSEWYAFTAGAGANNLYGVFFPTAHTGYAAGVLGTDAAIYKFQSVPQPTAQPTSLSFSAVSATGATITFLAPSPVPDGYLVLRRQGSPPTSTPLDGVEYTAGTVIGNATVAYSGSSLSFSENSLSAGTDYYYNVYAYNSGGASGSTDYLLTAPLSGNTTTTLLPPTAANSSSIGAGGFTASWSTVSGASSYRLDVSADGFTTLLSGYNDLVVGTTSESVTGLSSGTLYSYRVRAVNVSGASTNSNVITTLTLPAAPIATAATLISTISLTANWTASVGATGYLFDLSTTNFSSYVGSYHDFSLTASQLSITGLTAGTTYQYRIRAVNATGTSAYSSTITTPLICDPPGATTATSISSAGFTANWSPSTGAADYRLDLATDVSFAFIVGSFNNFTVTGSSKVVTGLSAGSTYYYRLRAANTSGSSANSSVISVLTWPSAPVANDATSIGSGSFVANWSIVPTATSYKLDVSTSAGFSSFISGYNDASVGGNSTTVTVPTEGITYYYRVRAVNSSGTSVTNSNVITTLLKPAVPVASAATSITGTGFTANWATASGATGYTLEVSSDNFVTNEPAYDNASVSGTSIAVTDLMEGISYKYRVRAANSQWSSGTSNTITVGTIPPSPSALTPTAITTTGLTAKWAATAGATSYRLDVSQDNFTTLLAGYSNLTVAGTSGTVTGLAPGITYHYRVRAVNVAGTSPNSNTIAVSTLPSPPVANAGTSVLSSGFTASWGAITGATDYRIEVSQGPSFSTFEGIYNNLTVSSTSINVTGLSAGGTYYYRVRANNASGASSNSNVVTTLLRPSAPAVTAATSVTINSLTANWEAIAGATDYRLDVSANDFISNLTDYNNLSVTGTSQVVTGLTPGATYKYRVRAVNATGASENSSAIAALTVPPAPVATTATQVTTTGFTATWSTLSSIPAYYLDVSTDNTFATFLPGYDNFPSTTGSQTITGLNEGVTYYYRVRAANVSGTSSNSITVPTVTLPVAPVADAASAITASGFTASWNSVSGAADYRIDVSTDIGFSFYVGSYFNQQVAGTQLPVAGLSAGTVYYYRVRAVNASGGSANSLTISALTLPGAPVAFDALSVTGNTMVANWGSVSTATSYRIDVSTASNFSTFVAGYEDLTVNTTSSAVTLPAGGSTYYYRVRAVSSAGVSGNSNTVATLLRPAPPVVTAATSVTAEGFTPGWLAAAGATGYYLDVSSNNFASYITPYENFLLPGTSVAIGGLSAGTNYQYRVRSYNASGASSNSDVMTTVTIPPPPVTVQSTAFTTTSFTANWQAAVGATSYRLDVATDFGFGSGTFVSGYQDLVVTTTSMNIADLQAGTVYYYRVRAVNASGTSPNSNVTSSTNVPPQPTGLVAASITTTALSVSWTATAGALSYALDVSSNHFASFVNAYNNLNVNGTTLNLVALAPGTSFQIRVRAVNASGTSGNSAVLTVQTLPEEPSAQPGNMLFTDITSTSMKISYSAPAGGAAGYLVLRTTASAVTGAPVDALSYNLGAVLGDGTIAYVGNAVTFNDSGLSAGEKYFYVIFAYNGAGSNTNYLNTIPLVASQVTVPPVPVLSTATTIGQTSFTANWSAVKGAEDYLIDVSVDDFTTFVAGYSAHATGNLTSITVTELSPGVTYKYLLRAKNSGGVSANSVVQSALTIPATPADLASSAITATSFELSWTAVSGAVNYLVDLSTDENFSILAVNAGNTTDPKVTFSGLGNSTKYYARVRSANASGMSPSSTSLSATTLSGGSGPAALTIGTPSFTPTMKSAAVAVTVTVTGGADPKTVKLRHRKITGSTFSEISVPPKTGNVYEVSIQPDMTDELGVEFYFIASDVNGTTDESDQHYFIHQAIDAASNKVVPFTLESFDGKAGSYQMFSIPYELADNNIVNIFEPALNGFSNTRWRLLRYVNGNYIEYPDQLKKIELGQGYWFNTIQTDFEIKLQAAVADAATPQSPFEIALEQGWNQIGDPYPFNVEWSAVQSANAAAGLSALWQFEEGSFVKNSVLPAWNGAFVFSDNGGKVVFPLSSRTSSGGRVQREPALDHSAGEWHLQMKMEIGDVLSVFSVGMRSAALKGKDKYDEIALPRFMDYAEVTTFHPEFFAPNFSCDVVPVTGSHSWEFTLSTNVKDGNSTVSWDPASLSSVKSSVYLLDVLNQRMVNMKIADRCSLNPREGQKLKIIVMPFNDHEFETAALGVAYPNPFIDVMRVPLFVETQDSRVKLQVYTAMGQAVSSVEREYKEPGYYEIEWGVDHRDPAVTSEGLLLYRVSINGVPSSIQRIVRANR